MNGGNQVTINISTVAILKIVAVFLVLGFIYLVRDIILTVFIAIILAALIPVADPAVRRTNRLAGAKLP